MARMFPQSVVDLFRHFNDIAVSIYGIDCTLFEPADSTVINTTSVYDLRADLPFKKDEISTEVFIEWTPSMKRLKKLGIFTEKESLPILAWFKNLLEIQRGCYIKIDIQYALPYQHNTDEFDLVECVIKNVYDAVVLQCWKLAPRRIKHEPKY